MSKKQTILETLGVREPADPNVKTIRLFDFSTPTGRAVTLVFMVFFIAAIGLMKWIF